MALDFQLTSLLKLNLKLFLDSEFIRVNAFRNISSGTLFYDGSDMSQLLPDGQAHNQFYGLNFGQIWQLPFRELIYEKDNFGINQPISMSGVYIEGTFRPTNDAEFGHIIDYVNARIIFNNPQSPSLKVSTDFAIRDVRITFENQFNNQYQESVLNTKFSNNPLISNTLVYPSGGLFPFPAVFIQTQQREFSAFELGNRSQIIEERFRLHVWAQNDIERDNIVDILTAQINKNIPIIDFNRAPMPLSGIHNTLSYEYVPYQTLVHNDVVVTTVGSGVPIRYLAFIDELNSQTITGAETYERSIVDIKLKVYLNAPTTPFGTLWAPITSIPSI